MTRKQRRFVAEYLKDQNGTQAAIRAGYAHKSAAEQASRMLTKDKIKAAVEAGLKKAEDDAGVSAAWILTSLKEVANRCMQKVPVMVRDPSDGKLIQDTDPETGEGLWEFDSSGANRSLELLGKNKSLFVDNVKHSGSISLEKLLGETNE